MKKAAIISGLAVIFATAGAFYHSGAPEAVKAQDPIQAETTLEEKPQEQTQAEQPQEQTQAEQIAEEVTQPAEAPKTNTPPTDNNKEKTFIFHGEKYFLTMDKKLSPNYAHKIDAAIKHGVELYGIPNSDVSAFVKDGKGVSSQSVGSIKISREYAGIVKDLLKGMEGIEQNIDLVLKTGAKVHVDFGGKNYAYYKISISGNDLIVHYN